MKIEPLQKRVAAFGAHAVEIDGHDMEVMDKAFANRPLDKPLVILARTNPSEGVPVLQDRAPVLHYLRFGSDIEKAKFQQAFDAMKIAMKEGA